MWFRLARRAGVGGVLCTALGCGTTDRVEPRGDAIKVRPPEPCVPERTTVPSGSVTPFGSDAAALLDHLELGTPSPLFWMPFQTSGYPRDEGPTVVRISPELAPTVVSLEMQPRTRDAQFTSYPRGEGSTCPDDTLSVPVAVSLSTADGALDEPFDADLEFSSGKTAHLSAHLAVDELGGTSSSLIVEAPVDGWRVAGLDVDIAFWPGGSSGSLSPVLVYSGPLLPASPPVLPPRMAPILAVPVEVTNGGRLAMWPRNLACVDDVRGFNVARDAEERVIGWSSREVTDALDAVDVYELREDGGVVTLRFALEAPSGIHCVYHQGRDLTFEAIGRVTAEAPAGSALEHLDARVPFLITARSSADGLALERLSWVRQGVTASQSRTDLQASTGLAVAPADEPRAFWWSWHGAERRSSSSAAPTSRALFQIRSAVEEPTAGSLFEGSPPLNASVDEDGFPQLPGAPLFSAEWTP